MSFQPLSSRSQNAKIDEEMNTYRKEVPGTSSKVNPEVLVTSTDQDEDSRRFDMESNEEVTQCSVEENVKGKGKRNKNGIDTTKGKSGMKGKELSDMKEEVEDNTSEVQDSQPPAGIESSMDESLVIASGLQEDKPER